MAYPWQYSPQQGDIIQAVHINELKNAADHINANHCPANYTTDRNHDSGRRADNSYDSSDHSYKSSDYSVCSHYSEHVNNTVRTSNNTVCSFKS